MKKRKMRKLMERQGRELAERRMEVINLKNKLSTVITLKSGGQDVIMMSLEELVLCAVYAGAGTREYDMLSGRHWDDIKGQITPEK